MRVFYPKRGEVRWFPVWDRAVREAVMEYKSSKTVSHAASQSATEAASSSRYSNICQGGGRWGGVKDLRRDGIQRGEWETGSGFHRRPRYFHFCSRPPPPVGGLWRLRLPGCHPLLAAVFHFWLGFHSRWRASPSGLITRFRRCMHAENTPFTVSRTLQVQTWAYSSFSNETKTCRSINCNNKAEAQTAPGFALGHIYL